MLEIIERPFNFALVMHIPICYVVVPLEVVYIVYFLDIHGDALNSVCQLAAYGMKVDASRTAESM